MYIGRSGLPTEPTDHRGLYEPISAFCDPCHIHGTLRIGLSVMYIGQSGLSHSILRWVCAASKCRRGWHNPPPCRPQSGSSYGMRCWTCRVFLVRGDRKEHLGNAGGVLKTQKATVLPRSILPKIPGTFGPEFDLHARLPLNCGHGVSPACA